MRYLHTMVRVRDLDASLRFYCEGLGLRERRRMELDAGRFTLVFLSSDETPDAEIELTYNHGVDHYEMGTAYGHVALGVPDVYAACEKIRAGGGNVTREPGPVKGGNTVIALRATARLQLHPGFTLRDAAARVPYYARLGISHLYLSPITRAVAGSTHGYDVVDPATVSPELKSRFELSPEAAGVVIVGLDADGPAAEQGLREGDLIEKVSQQEVKTPADVARLAEAAQNSKQSALLLLVNRQGDSLFVALKLAET